MLCSFPLGHAGGNILVLFAVPHVDAVRDEKLELETGQFESR